jgi:membrane fusion protein, adhesin transport system
MSQAMNIEQGKTGDGSAHHTNEQDMSSMPTTGAPGASPAPDWLTTPIEFEEERGFRVARKGMRVLVVLVVAALVWASVMPIRELSLAKGQLIPVSQVRPVQHLEGGIVDAILVKEGDIVQEQQPLMRMNAVLAESELSTLRMRAENLVLLKERVEALLAGRPVNFAGLRGGASALAGEHRQVWQRRVDQREKERRLLITRIAQREAEVSALRAEIATGRNLVGIEEQQLDMRRRLVAAGTASKKQMLDVETTLEQARARLQASEGKLAATEQALAEAKATLAESDAEAHKLWSEELVKASAELGEVQEAIHKHEDRVNRLTVRAPAKGRVQHMLQRSAGEVVRPGETVARIVPLDDALVAEVRVKPEDIAAVKLGDSAEIKVTAYDFSRYGKIKGKVSDISPTTFEDENRQHYYKVLIRCDLARPGKPGADWQLQPGMTVDAEIVSGSKTLLQYLVKPIYRGVDIAFSER